MSACLQISEECLEEHLAQAEGVVDECLQRFALESIAVAFNGGKDCCVVLELLARRLPVGALAELLVVHFDEHEDEFEELEQFVQRDTVERYGLRKLRVVRGMTMRQGLALFPHVQAWVSGRRFGDPHVPMQHFSGSTPGWPPLTNVLPILRWPYGVVWRFLLAYCVPYPLLYDKGYTSLGTASRSRPNPRLRSADGSSYLPAYALVDERDERLSRVN